MLYSDLPSLSLNFPLLPSYKVIDIISNRVSIPIIVLVSITNLTSTLFSTCLRFRYSQLIPLASLTLLIVQSYQSLIDSAAIQN